MRPDDLIINRPDRQRPGQRYGYAVLTLAFWALWLYLWLPLASAVAWLIGARIFYHEMVVLEGYAGVLEVLLWYGAVVLAIVVAMVGWMTINLLRFGRGKDARRSPRAVTERQTAEHFGVSVEDLHALRGARRLVIDVGSDGRVSRVELGFPTELDERDPRALGR